MVDAIQSVGAIGVDVKACNVDILAADGHKWLLAPEGAAIFYCAKEKQDALINTKRRLGGCRQSEGFSEL